MTLVNKVCASKSHRQWTYLEISVNDYDKNRHSEVLQYPNIGTEDPKSAGIPRSLEKSPAFLAAKYPSTRWVKGYFITQMLRDHLGYRVTLHFRGPFMSLQFRMQIQHPLNLGAPKVPGYFVARKVSHFFGCGISRHPVGGRLPRNPNGGGPFGLWSNPPLLGPPP